MSKNGDTDKDQELADARYWKGQYENRLRSYQNRYNSNNEKLKRIRKVKKAISSAKDTIKDSSKAQKKHATNADTYYEWNGDKQASVYSMYAETVTDEYKTYNKNVDTLLDSIVDLETYYENDNLEMLGLIGEVSGWINSLAGKIEKLLN